MNHEPNKHGGGASQITSQQAYSARKQRALRYLFLQRPQVGDGRFDVIIGQFGGLH